MAHTSEYEIEDIFIDRLEGIGYKFIKLNNYDEVLANFREQLAKFNAKKLEEKGHTASFSDSEFNRIMIHVDNHSVYESAKVLRDKYDLQLDNGESVYIEFFSGDTDRNIYQVTHQVTMDKAHKDDVVYKNRYDVTVLINGLPLVQIELKRPGVEINEAINQINRYRKFSFKGIFRYLQLFVVSNSVQTKYFCNENEMLDGQYNPILKSLVFFWTDEKNTRINDLNTFTGEFFRKSAITEMLNKYMVIKTTEPVLMVMRPYQIYAVKAAKKRVLEVNQNGYVFACTGSGKTLTSFKLAQILRDEPMVDLVVFLIDRKDLDDQTIDEYNSFEKDCVDRTNSTAVLINMLKSSEKKMIVTTIQKMANAVKNPKYAAVMDAYKDKKVVFIIDECHRSQFGKMHSLIQKHFERANYIGFTGTPIFERNKGVDGRTTADVFYAGDKLDACLHKYMIKDAIADGNVLRFSVEYQSVVSAEEISINGIDPKQLDDPEYCRRHNIDIESLYHNDERISKIAKHIFEHHEQHAHPQGKDIYTALFAVDKIQTLGKYYDEFKKLNDVVPEDKKLKIAAVFSYQTNEDMDDGADEHSQELLERCMKDYKDLFGVEFTFGTFDAYRKDITRRLKQQDSPQIDILLVVNMFLTGFDAKPLNTLYLDKNLIWHSLVQAYSRTNRVDKVTKQFGQIVTYRNIKKWQDDALTLFSGDGDPNEYLLENFEYYLNQWKNQELVLKWSADKKFEDDPRYRGVGKLAPKSAADLAFVEHMIYHMDETDGRVAVLLPHGVLFRGGAEEAIRKYIIKDLNRLDAVIGLPANLFHGTGIPVCVLVLKSNRNGNSGNILFIDASKEFKPGKNQNILEQEHIDKIVDAYEKRAEIDKFAHKAYMSEIIENGYNLNIPRYVDTFEEEEPVDLDAVRNRIKTLDSETKAAIDKAESFMRELGL